jgi:branched-chain amino acid transport system ATP-binding protein
VLELRDVEVRYGNIRALQGVSLIVAQGELVALIGSNGAGKTTTLRTISGLLRPADGSITFEGAEISRAPTDRIVSLGIGHCPEGRRIFGGLTVRENLVLGAVTQRDRSAVDAELDNVFTLFPLLKERLGQAGGTLSGGEQQMLAIGRALMRNPGVLLLDEPSEGLAPKLVADVGDALRSLRGAGLAILLIEQNLALATRVGERLYVMNKGTIVFGGTAAELAAQPEVEARYLGV